MEGYQRRPPGSVREAGAPGAGEALNEAGAFLRRLIPFAGTDVLSPLSLLPQPRPTGGVPSHPAVAAVSDIVGQGAASIVSQAASILDEEMARGVLAARHSVDTVPPGQSNAGNPGLRQVHDLVDNLAAIWPSLQRAPVQPAASPPAASTADPLAEVRPRATVKPGQRATISMTLRNSESHSVRLVPASTDLLGSRGGRIASTLLEFTPAEFSLESQEQRDMTIAALVPAEAAPGCYSGLLVVRGVDYLRALITIEVV